MLRSFRYFSVQSNVDWRLAIGSATAVGNRPVLTKISCPTIGTVALVVAQRVLHFTYNEIRCATWQ
jgi:hypothetical protein